MASPALQSHADLAPPFAPRAVVHDLDGAGPIFAAAFGPDGRRFFSDESRHRLIVEEPGGLRRALGRPGTGPGEFRYPRGVAAWSDPDGSGLRLYVCDSWNHRIQIFDGVGTPLGAFGRRGSAPGEFDVPSDIVLASPAGEGSQPLLIVADRWNNRVQVFDTDGAHVASVGTREAGIAARGGDPIDVRAGHPHFRVAPDPVLWFPNRLAWRSPWLEVTGASGLVVTIDLAAALLPDFDSWLTRASLAELRDASSRARRGGRYRVPPAVSAAIDTEIGCALAARGSLVSAARAWSAPWPDGLAVAAMEEQLARRAQAVIATWLRSSGAGCTARLIEAVSSALAEVRTTRARGASHAEVNAVRARQAACEAGAEPAPDASSERTDRLAHQLRVLRGRSRVQGRVVWTAPAGDLRLGTVAEARGVTAVASESGGALWLFDDSATPMARLSLPDGMVPGCLAAHPRGGWLLGERSGRVVHLDDRGEVAWSFDLRRAGIASLAAMAVIDARLFVADLAGDRLVAVTWRGEVDGECAGAGDPAAIAIREGRPWIASWRDSALREIDPASGQWTRSLSHPLIAAPHALAVASGGALVGAERWLGRVWAISADGTWLGMVEAADGRALGRPGGVAVRPDGSVMVSDRDAGTLVCLPAPSGESEWALR